MKSTSDNRRMKRIAIAAVAFVLAASPQAVWAIDETELTNDRIEYIRNNCGDTQTALGGIRATDKVAYVNIGQQLDTLSNRLMAPMNSRVAINKLDGVALTKTTVDFNAEIKRFQALYREYERGVDVTVAMGCYNQPVEFYDNLTALLQKRVDVRASFERLSLLVAQYRANVTSLRDQALAGSQQP